LRQSTVTDNAASLIGQGLTRAYGHGPTRVVVLDGVSIELWPGEVTLLMGPSGSGKSTLLALLSGLLRPDAGRVHALGQDLWSLDDPARERFRLEHCGFIFQGFNLIPALTAHDQIEMVLRWGQGLRHSEAARKTSEMLERLDMSTKARLRPAELSGGEQQRVAIGRALVKDPRLCFADEPTAALDWSHGRDVITLLKAAARERGATILVVTHDPRLLPHADRVYHLVDGRLSDPPESESTISMAVDPDYLSSPAGPPS
jgi:putative ABC transport system ATP-binding protein